MARVSLELPPILTSPDVLQQAIAEAARVAMDAELPSALTEIARKGEVPRNLGILQAAVVNAAEPAQIVGDRVVSRIVVAGEASSYAAVQDLGRRAGKRMSWRVLYYGPGARGVPDGWRSGWVNRKLRDWVLEVAASLRAQDEAKRGTARIATKRSQLGALDERLAGSGLTVALSKVNRQNKLRLQTYERRAAYLLSVSIASRIRARGMVGKRFIDGNRKLIQERVQALVSAEIGRAIRRLGIGGDQ